MTRHLPMIVVGIFLLTMAGVLVVLLVLGGGGGEKARIAKFAARCDKAGFTPPQCAMLYDIHKTADDAETLAIINLAIGTAKSGAKP